MRYEPVLTILIIFTLMLSGCFGDDGKSDDKDNDLNDVDNDEDGNNSTTNDTNNGHNNTSSYQLHRNITVTIFWIGEEAKEENGWVPNTVSAWDDKWFDHFGGLDDPDERSGYHPAAFTPGENPFYIALPFNDFNENGKRKPEVNDRIYWAGEKSWGERESMCKNRWLKITKGDSTAYAQWEDTGPFVESDIYYVFGSSEPENHAFQGAGLDVSPAVRDYIGLKNYDMVDWEFVDHTDVPDGPWKDIETSRQVYWE